MTEGIMTEDLYGAAIVMLLPMTACMLVFQTNPYHALVIRGMVGAVAALVYALFGAADVALTEALVGTMLSITLYAVAVRSSLSMRIGVLSQPPDKLDLASLEAAPHFEALRSALRQALSKYHMGLEVISYPTPEALQTALSQKDIHASCIAVSDVAIAGGELAGSPSPEIQPGYQLQIRIRRLYDILQAGLPLTAAQLTYIEPVSGAPMETSQAGISMSQSAGELS